MPSYVRVTYDLHTDLYDSYKYCTSNQVALPCQGRPIRT